MNVLSLQQPVRMGDPRLSTIIYVLPMHPHHRQWCVFRLESFVSFSTLNWKENSNCSPEYDSSANAVRALSVNLLLEVSSGGLIVRESIVRDQL